MDHVAENNIAMIETARTRSIALGVAKEIEPRLLAFALQCAQDPDVAMAQHYVPITRFLNRVASALDILRTVDERNVGPLTALLRSADTGVFRACSWKSILQAWTEQQTTEQNDDPHAPFRMEGEMFVLASPDTHDTVREIMRKRHGEPNALSLIIEIKRFNGTEWAVVQDETLALQVLKECIAQRYRRQLRQPWTHHRADGRFSLTVSPRPHGPLTIVAHVGAEPLNLRILDKGRDEFGMRFTDPVATSAVVQAGIPTDDNVCPICVSYECEQCDPKHIPRVLGCGNPIHRCCFLKDVERRRRLGNHTTNCIYCFRHIDLTTFH